MEMSETGAIKVDWLNGRAESNVASDEPKDEEMEVEGRGAEEEWTNNRGHQQQQQQQDDNGEREEDDNQEDGSGGLRTNRGGVAVMTSGEEADEESSEDRMLELRLSLVVERTVPPAQHQQSGKSSGSFHVDQRLNNYHRHNSQEQQLLPTTSVGGGRRSQSPVKKQVSQMSSSLQENQREGSSRPNLTASLKHLVSQQQQQQQQPVRMKTAPPRMLSGVVAALTAGARHSPLSFGAVLSSTSPVASQQQHVPRPQPLPSLLHGGNDALEGPAFFPMGVVGRPASSVQQQQVTASASPPAQGRGGAAAAHGLVGGGGQRMSSGGAHLSLAHLSSAFPKKFPHLQSPTSRQPRLPLSGAAAAAAGASSVSTPPANHHRIYARSASSPGVLQQSLSARDVAQQGHSGPPQTPPGVGGRVVAPGVAAAALARIFATSSSMPAGHITAPQAPPSQQQQQQQQPLATGGGPQLQAFLQHQASNAVSVVSHRQVPNFATASHPEVSGPAKNLSAFAVVRPSLSAAVQGGSVNAAPRERVADDAVVVNICDRKVRLTSDQDLSSLYALCRRWVRNDMPRRDQPVLWDCPPLPKPLAAEVAAGKSETQDGNNNEEGAEEELSDIDSVSEEKVLQHHVGHFKRVRKRFKDKRKRKIARFMPRLALLLPVVPESAVNSRRDVLTNDESSKRAVPSEHHHHS